MRHTATFLLLAAAALVSGGSAAAADPVVDGLRGDRLYVAPDAAISPDRDRVLAALEGSTVPVYIAVVAQADVDAEQLGIDGLLLRLVDQLAEPGAVVLLVTDGQEEAARDGGTSGTDPGAALDQVLAARIDEPFTPANLTDALVDFAALVGGGAGSEAGSTRRTVGLVGLVAVAALGGGGWLYARSQRRVLADAPLTAGSEVADAGWQPTREQR